MNETIIRGKLHSVDVDGNVVLMHPETTASDVLVERSMNLMGDDSKTAIPSDVDTLQKMVNKLGKLAFKSHIDPSDLVYGLVVNNFTTTVPGSALDAVKGKELHDRVSTIEDSELLVIGTDVEDSDDILPVSEINDAITGVAATWSSDKIIRYIDSLMKNCYIDLNEISNDVYETNVTLAEIEDAYQKRKQLWVTANDLHLPLRVRNSATDWIFSGYVDGQICDIQINDNGVTKTYADVSKINYTEYLAFNTEELIDGLKEESKTDIN